MRWTSTATQQKSRTKANDRTSQERDGGPGGGLGPRVDAGPQRGVAGDAGADRDREAALGPDPLPPFPGNPRHSLTFSRESVGAERPTTQAHTPIQPDRRASIITASRFSVTRV